MQISSFTAPKDRRLRVPSDDTVLILPDVLAVFDGATAPQASREGVSSGRLASRAAAHTIAELAASVDLVSLEATEIFAAINDRIHQESRREGMEGKPSTTLAMAVLGATEIRLLVHGDSGIRVNGARLFVDLKFIDQVSLHNRLAVHALVAARHDDPDQVERLTRCVTFEGHDRALEKGLLSQAEIATVRQKVLAHVGNRIEHEPVIAFLDAGLCRQYEIANRRDHPLGFATLNGDRELVPGFIDERLPRGAVNSLEIFTDGYFSHPETVGIAAWEASFAATEAEDFRKLHRFAGVKGSTATEFADDRSIIVAEFISGKP